jgi:TrpR family transcriptional regulator, trp operon repressor
MVMAKSGWREFLKLCTEIKSPDDLNQLFDLFFTLEEKETLASRYNIIKALVENRLTQREIAEKCKVSIAQISRGSNALKIISPKLKEILQKHA